MNDRATALADALLFEESDAVFSADRVYRYRLWRIWDRAKPRLLFCMLNPSTADEVKNDPTVARCQRRALALGDTFGGVEVVNIFALRSTDPKALYSHPRPIGEVLKSNRIGSTYTVGEENDSHIWAACGEAGMVIAAWGEHGKHLGRGAAVKHRLMASCRLRRINLCALKVNASGEPAHPLYLPYDLQPFEFDHGEKL